MKDTLLVVFGGIALLFVAVVVILSDFITRADIAEANGEESER